MAEQEQMRHEDLVARAREQVAHLGPDERPHLDRSKPLPRLTPSSSGSRLTLADRAIQKITADGSYGIGSILLATVMVLALLVVLGQFVVLVVRGG